MKFPRAFCRQRHPPPRSRLSMWRCVAYGCPGRSLQSFASRVGRLWMVVLFLRWFKRISSDDD
eukprot:4432334-Lingulodinium_polyedra.AAC.1